MNSVHEPCPNGDLEIALSRKTGWVHQVHSLLAQQHAPVRTDAPGRAHMAVSWRPPASCRGRDPGHVASLHGRIAVRRLSCRSAHAPAPARRAAHALPRAPARLAMPCRSAPSGHVVGLAGLYCNTAQPCLFAPQLQYTLVYCDTNSSPVSSSHNTLHNVLQHPSSKPVAPIAIHLDVLQYNNSTYQASCNTIPLQYNFCPHSMSQYNTSIATQPTANLHS